MTVMGTCGCDEYREAIPANADHHGICKCTHERDPYHKRRVGPCWYPTVKAGK